MIKAKLIFGVILMAVGLPIGQLIYSSTHSSTQIHQQAAIVQPEHEMSLQEADQVLLYYKNLPDGQYKREIQKYTDKYINQN